MEMRNLKLVLIIAGALSLLIVGVACGDRSAETVADSTTETSPTAGPITQTTPTPTPTAETAPTATNVPAQVVAPSDEGIEGMLSGDTLARYRALPPAFQAALDTYAWFGVPPDLIPLAVRDKMDQWGDAAVPLAEIIGEERAERFRDPRRHSSSVFSKRIQVRHADLLLSGYVYLLALEPSAERRLELMRQLANGPMDSTGFTYPSLSLA